jgi:hypothetical protein
VFVGCGLAACLYYPNSKHEKMETTPNLGKRHSSSDQLFGSSDGPPLTKRAPDTETLRMIVTTNVLDSWMSAFNHA